MKKYKNLCVVLLLFIALILTSGCRQEEKADDEVACTHIANDYGWQGYLTLTTSDPISDSGWYYYDMYCVEVTAGKTYELKFFSDTGYWIGLSIWEDYGEHEIFYTNSTIPVVYYETASETATAKISVWIHKDQLAGGTAAYNIWIMEQ